MIMHFHFFGSIWRINMCVLTVMRQCCQDRERHRSILTWEKESVAILSQLKIFFAGYILKL